MVKELKSHTQIVVIGGGIMGCSLLYQLVRQGCRDVVLLEKGELTSGSTWHAAGQVPHFSEHPLFARIQYESFESYKQLERDEKQPTGVKPVGSLRLARTKSEMLEYRRFLPIAKRLGIEAELIGPNETRSLWPLLELRGFEGALHTFNDGYTDPSQTTHAFANAARQLGAEITRHTRVTGINKMSTGNWKIETERGSIQAEKVVNATGFWGSEISEMIGAELPVLAMEHEYLVTESDNQITSGLCELPVLRDLNVPTYLRQEQGGLLVACYEDEPVFWGLSGIPKDFGQELLPPNIERAESNLSMTSEMVPILKRLGVKSVVNGPTGRTADLKPCIGPAHGAPGYYTFCGAVGGFLQSGFARYLAEWILDGEPSIDLSPVDVRRFGEYATQSYAVTKVSGGHAYSSPVNHPHTQPSRGRLARCSPLYGILRSKGACFGVENGWEIANWFAPLGKEPVEKPSFTRQNWAVHAASEALRTLKSAGLLDRSATSKFVVSGPDSGEYLSSFYSSPLPKDGQWSHGLSLTKSGHVAVMTNIARLENSFYLHGEGSYEQHLLDWLIKHRASYDVDITNSSSLYGMLWLGGPQTTRTLESTGVDTAFDIAPGDFIKATIGHSKVWIARIDDVTTPAYTITHDMRAQIAVYDALSAAGTEYGLVDLGHRGYHCLRFVEGLPAWGADISGTTLPSQVNLNKLVETDPANTINHTRRPKHVLVRLQIACSKDNTADPWGSEPVYSRDQEVGSVTSGTFTPDLKSSLAFAYLENDYSSKGASLDVEILGHRHSAIVLGNPVFKLFTH